MKISSGNDDNALSFEASIETSEFDKGVKKVEKGIDQITETAEKSADDIGKNVGKKLIDLEAHHKAILDKYAKIAKESAEIYKNKQAVIIKPETKENNLKELTNDVLDLKDATVENNKAQEIASSILDDVSAETFTLYGAIGFVTGFLYQNRKEIFNWIGSLLKGADATAAATKALKENLAIELALRDARLKGAQAAVQETTNLQTLYKAATNLNVPLAERNKIVTELQALYPDFFKNFTAEEIAAGKAAGAYDLLATAILAAAKARAAQDAIAKNATRALENDFKQADLALEREKARAKVAKAAADQAFDRKNVIPGVGSTNYGGTGTSVSDFNLKVAKKELNEVNKQISDIATDSNILNRKNEKLANDVQASIEKNGAVTLLGINTNKPKAEKVVKDIVDKTVSERKSLMKQLTSIDAEYTRKSFTKDEEEVQALKDKFAKIRTTVEAFNKANPKKAINLVELNELEKTSSYDLAFRQETEKFKASLDEQKKAFEAYEAYKLTFGEAAANERFGNEAKTFEGYLAKLKSEYSLTLAQGAVSGNTGPITARLQIQEKAIKAGEDLQAKNYDDLLKQLLSYEQKRTILIEQYQVKRNELESKGNSSAITVLDTIHKEAIDKIDDENVQKLESYKNLFSNIDDLSSTAAKKVIDNGRSMLAKLIEGGKISSELAKELTEKLKETSTALDSRLPTNLKKLGSELKGFSSLVGNVGSGFGSWLNGISDVVTGLGTAKEQIAGIKELKKGDTLGAISGGLGLFSTFMGIGKTLGDFFSRGAAERAEQQKYANDLQLKQYDAISKALERQIALINEAYGVEKIEAYSSAISKAKENQADLESKLSTKYKLTGDKNLDDILSKANNGEKYLTNGLTIAAVIKKNQAEFDKLKLPSDTESLRKLLESNLLDANTAALVQNLLEARQAVVDLGKEMKVNLTGTNFESLTDNIINAVTEGANDGSKNFEDIMRKALLNSLKSTALTNSIKEFYDNFYDAASSGNQLTQAEIEALRAKYDKIIADGKAAAENLEKVTGVSLSDANDTKKQGELSKGISAITETTANRLEAEFGGLRLAQLQLLGVTGTNHAELMQMNANKINNLVKIEANTGRTANNTDKLANIEKALISLDKKASDESSKLRGAGI